MLSRMLAAVLQRVDRRHPQSARSQVSSNRRWRTDVSNRVYPPPDTAVCRVYPLRSLAGTTLRGWWEAITDRGALTGIAAGFYEWWQSEPGCARCVALGNPSGDVPTRRTRHRTVHTIAAGHEACVDTGIVELIAGLWQSGFTTLASCEDSGPWFPSARYINILFPYMDGERFLHEARFRAPFTHHLVGGMDDRRNRHPWVVTTVDTGTDLHLSVFIPHQHAEWLVDRFTVDASTTATRTVA